MRIVFISLGTIVRPKINWKQSLCKIWRDKQKVLWYFPKWPIKSSNNNVIFNCYKRKQQTLSFQCRDGPSLRDKLVDLVQKKPGTTTDLQHPGLSVSTEQATQPHYGKQTVVRSAIVDYRSMTRDRKL